MAAVARRRYKLRVHGKLGWKTAYVRSMASALYNCRLMRHYGIAAYWEYV